MGLDMYAFSLPKAEGRPCVDFDIGEVPQCERCQLHYWRKHPNLYGWMAGIYYEKGGSDDDFNINTVELTPEDIDALERTILENRLPDTSGFFFGETTGEEREDDLEFIRKAREELAKGRTIAYYAWW
jgi:hypothetical protein